MLSHWFAVGDEASFVGSLPKVLQAPCRPMSIAAKSKAFIDRADTQTISGDRGNQTRCLDTIYIYRLDVVNHDALDEQCKLFYRCLRYSV
jgi:hypothetical protein